MKGEDNFSDERLFTAIKQGSIDDAVAAWPEIRPKTEEITAEWIRFRNAVTTICREAVSYYLDCQRGFTDPIDAKKKYAMFVMDKYKPFSSFLFTAIKENADIEKLYDKIEYKELKNFWIPAIETFGLSL